MIYNIPKPIKIRKIKQVFCKDYIADIPLYISQAFQASNLPSKIKSGHKIGITVGSRGIANMNIIAKQLINELKNIKAEPFILAAMGSHGGATSEGQREVLASYGITEESMGVTIYSSMETTRIGMIVDKVPVYFSQDALKADGIIALNRVKLHTDFESDLESGMSKVMVIGLGKKDGAESIHSLGIYGLKEILPQAAQLIINKTPIIQGIGIVENGYDQTMEIEFCTPENIIQTDKKLLKKCREVFPSLPTEKIDILIAQEMGKNISGTGLDTNVIGKLGINGVDDSHKPDISKLIVLDITDESHGNALGVGLADVTTRKLVNKINFKDTYANTITSTFLKRAQIPVTAETEKEALEIAYKTCWQPDIEKLRLIIVKNTLELENLLISKAIWDDLQNNKSIIANGDWEELSFNENKEIINRL
ncbi:MAG: lactate racemase domain-containing protein [Atribacterota bacterium]|nr:lactate racemase domain-containing protein [Atribacterota bacterium]